MCFVCAQARVKSGEHENHIHVEMSEVQANLARFAVAELSLGSAASTTNVDQYINTIATGLNWTGNVGESATVTYSFDNSGIDTTVVYASNHSAFTSAQQQAAVQAMNHMSSFANITFVEAATSSAAQIHFYNGDLGGNTAGIAGYYYFGNKLDYAAIGMDDGSQNFSDTSTYDYETFLHELGHAVGLKHSGNVSVGEQGPFLPSDLDNTALTVMSYNEVNTPSTSYQPLDVAALQYLYGSASSSDQPTTDDSTSSSDLDKVESNTLTADTPSDMKGGLGSDTLNGSNFNDTMFGGRAVADPDDAADQLFGNGGNDEMYGNTGNDTIYGDDESHIITGNDTIFGGFGTDSIFGGNGDDSLAGGGGIAHPEDEPDQIYAGAGNDSIVGNGGGDTIYGETGNDTFWGGFGDDIIFGGDGADVIAGQINNDALHGGAGADIFAYYGNDGIDVISDFNVNEDRLQFNGNLNNSGISSAEDILARLGTDGSFTTINLDGGSFIYLSVEISSFNVDHFIVL